MIFLYPAKGAERSGTEPGLLTCLHRMAMSPLPHHIHSDDDIRSGLPRCSHQVCQALNRSVGKEKWKISVPGAAHLRSPGAGTGSTAR